MQAIKPLKALLPIALLMGASALNAQAAPTPGEIIANASAGEWQTVSPNVTGAMTHDDASSAKSPFFWLASLRRFQV